jgi:hypothetical protein
VSTCPRCGAENAEEARFCERCGNRFARRPRWILPAALAVAVLALAGAAVASLTLGQEAPEEGASSPGASPTPTPSATETPAGPTEIRESFGPHFILGRRLSFSLDDLGTSRDDCVTNVFRFQGIGKKRGAYVSDCSDWARAGRDIYLFSVRFLNRTEERLRIERNKFVLVDRNGKRHRPIDVRDEALFPEAFLAKTETVRTDEKIDGWVVFDADPDFVPQELSYRDRAETLTFVFEGKVIRNPPR